MIPVGMNLGSVGSSTNSSSPHHPHHSQGIDIRKLKKQFEVPSDERCIQQFYCTLEGDKGISYNGIGFLFEYHLCFRNTSKARVVSVTIPLSDVTELETRMSSIIIPNLIRVGTKLKKYSFITDSQDRDSIFKNILAAWKKTSSNKYGDISKNLDRISKRLEIVKEELQREGIRPVDSSLDAFLTNTLKLPRTEALIGHFACTIEEGNIKVPTGRLYVTQNYVSFHENLRLVTKARKIVIDYSNIMSMEKHISSVWSLPNAIRIYTHSKKYSFSSFINRGEVYDLLRECWNAVRKRKGLTFEDEKDSEEDCEDHSEDDTFASEFEEDDEDLPYSFFEYKQFIDKSPDGVKLDLYGFEIPEEYVSTYTSELSKYSKNLTKQRRSWKYFKKNNNIDSHIQHHTPELMKMIRKGIPFEMRGELWYQFSGAKEKMENSKSVYSDLITKTTSYSTDIGKDLKRTFPYHPAFQSEESLKQLERVLTAYANRNPGIGYCQSMNFITALLLLFLPEEKAFWVLVTIVEDRLTEYFSETMIGTIVDQEVFEELLKQKFPNIMDHLESKSLPLAVITTKWFMCLFIGAVPSETLLRIWDLFFFHGSPVIITTALSLIKMYESEIMKVTSTEEFMSYSTTLGMNCYDVDRLFNIAFNVVGLIDNRHLNYIRARYWEATKDYLEDENKKRDFYILERSSHYSNQELNDWYKEYQEAKNNSAQLMSDCIPRDSPGVDFDAFYEIISKVARNWASEQAIPILKHLFSHLDRNKDQFIDFREMVSGISTICKGDPKEKTHLFFKMYSSSAVYLTRSEFESAIKAILIIEDKTDCFENLKNEFGDNETMKQHQFLELVVTNIYEAKALEPTPPTPPITSQPIPTPTKIITMERKPGISTPIPSYRMHQEIQNRILQKEEEDDFGPDSF